MMLVAIDPGKHASGWAAFNRGELVLCGYTGEYGEILSALGYQLYPGPELVVVEVPRVYDRRRWKGDPNDLIDIAVAGGVLAGALHPVAFKFVRPQDWKGQTPKKVQAERTLAKLSEVEREHLKDATAPYKLHNVIDAIGIGLWEIKRCAAG